MSGPIGAMTPRGDQDNVLARGPAEVAPPPPSVFHFDWDATKASAEQSYYDVPGRAQELRRNELLFSAAELARLNGKRASDYMLVFPGEPLATDIDENAFWRDLADVRRTRPDALKDLGADRTDYDARRIKRLQGGRANREIRMAQGGLAGNLLGGAAGAFTDPINILTMPIGGGGRTVAMQVLRAGVLNAGIEAAEQPLLMGEREAQGSELTMGEAAMNVAGAGIGGAALHGLGIGLGKTVELGARGAGKLYERAVPLDYRMAQALKKDLGGDWLMTPDQAAAVHVIERGAEVDAANPFADTYAGLDAHAARIDRVLGELASLPRPTSELAAATAAPELSVRARALSSTAGAEALSAPRGPLGVGAIDVLMNRIGRVESSGNDLARNPRSSAEGRYQFTDGTWLQTYKARFGASESNAAILAKKFDGRLQDQLMRDLTGANAAALQRAGIPATPGNLYLAHFAGEAGARKLHAAEPGAPVEAVLGAKVVAANPFLRGKSAAETIAWADRKMGGAGETVAAGPRSPELAGDDVEIARPADLDLDRPLVRDEVQHEGLVSAMRAIAADRGRSLNRIEEMAGELGVGSAELRGALDSLVAGGELTLTRTGVYRRAAAAGNSGPEDMLRFIAKRGGLAYDGLSENGRGLGTLGHDLKNSGNLAHFVPGAGPLLRPSGRGLDEMGELLHDAGYFGPPATTPRPTDGELITLIDDVIRRREKRYSAFDTAPVERVKGERTKGIPKGFQSEEHYLAERSLWTSAAERVLGRDLSDSEFDAALAISREGQGEFPEPSHIDWLDSDAHDRGEHLDHHVHAMVNRELDAALEDAYLEIEDPHYDAYLADEAGTPGQGRDGSAADAGDPGAGGEGAGSRPEAGESSELTPAQRDAAEAAGTAGPVLVDPKTSQAFDDPAGEGTKAAVDSMWHDLRAEFGEPQIDPAAAARLAEEIELRAQAVLRGENITGQAQDGTIGLDLFDAVDQPRFDLEDGKGARTVAEIDAELGALEAGIDAIKGCLK